MVTSMVSIIVEEENKKAIEKAKNGEKWQTLKFIVTQTSTSWDTWPAGWSWIEWKKFVVNVIGFPENEATYAQKWQMMRLKNNVKSISMNTSFSKIQESMLKWNTEEFREELKQIIKGELKELIEKYDFNIEIDAWSFNSINPWRVDWQTIYHSYWILQAVAQNIIEEDEEIIEVIPSWNWGHMYSVLMARLQTWKSWPTIITCNRNNMFFRIIEEWKFQKPEENSAIDEPSVSMIIEYPNNMIRLFSYAFWEERAKEITDKFFNWEEVILSDEERKILKEKLNITAVENSWEEELKTIGRILKKTGKLVCPHTANAILWLEKYRKNSNNTQQKALISATASPWKFLASIAAWLSFEEENNLEELYKQYKKLENSKEWTEELLKIIEEKFEKYWEKFSYDIIPENLREIYLNWYESEQSVSPEEFWNKTKELLKNKVAPLFRQQVEKLLK
jgi:threonine synthase